MQCRTVHGKYCIMILFWRGLARFGGVYQGFWPQSVQGDRTGGYKKVCPYARVTPISGAPFSESPWDQDDVCRRTSHHLKPGSWMPSTKDPTLPKELSNQPSGCPVQDPYGRRRNSRITGTFSTYFPLVICGPRPRHSSQAVPLEKAMAAHELRQLHSTASQSWTWQLNSFAT
eukprot:gene11192-biopygen18381